MKHFIFSFKGFLSTGHEVPISTACGARSTGRLGEVLAQQFLESKGYKCLGRNFCVQGGELDLIMLSPGTPDRHRLLVFIEVKTRRQDWFGEPEEALTKTKIQKLLRAIRLYLQKNEIKNPWRLDLITIHFRDPKTAEIKHYENVLED